MYNTAAVIAATKTPQATHTAITCGSYPPGTIAANCSSGAQDGMTSTATGESRVLLLLCLRSIAAFVWATSRSALQRMLLAYLQSVLVSPTWRSLLAAVPRGLLPVVSRGVALRVWDMDTVAHRALANSNGKKVSWSYLRGVSLALSELCQDGRFGGGRIPLSAILDLMRQHQSAFVPLGPHVEKDVPKRLVQLANENVVIFDPFEEYVIVPEATRQKFDSRRQALLAEGVDPADLSVFGAALTQGLSPSKRVTNATVASYKAQFLLGRQQQQHLEPQPQQKVNTKKTLGHSLTREESLLSIADAIRPASLGLETDMADEPPTLTRRGHSIVMDMAKIIGRKLEGSDRIASQEEGSGSQLHHKLGRSVLPEMSAIIHERDELEVENDRLRSILGTSYQ